MCPDRGIRRLSPYAPYGCASRGARGWPEKRAHDRTRFNSGGEGGYSKTLPLRGPVADPKNAPMIGRVLTLAGRARHVPRQGYSKTLPLRGPVADPKNAPMIGHVLTLAGRAGFEPAAEF